MHPYIRLASSIRRRPMVGVMIILIALIISGNGLVAPILSIYASTFSASATMVGMIITLFGVGRLIANMPAGILSQRFGRRPLLILGPAILVIGSIGAALATDITALLLWRFVQGIGSGIYMTTAAASLADIAAPGERGQVMALYQAGLLVGAGIGPAVGGTLATHFGFTAPFWAYAGVSALAMVVALVSARETATLGDAPAEEPATSAPPGTSLLRNTPFLLVCVVNFTVFFTRTASQWLLIPLVGHEAYGMEVDSIGFALALAALLNLILLPVVGQLIDRHGAHPVACWSGLAAAFSLVTIALGPGEPFFWLGVVMLGVSSAVTGPAVAAYSADAVSRRAYGPAMGLLRTCGDIGFVSGPILVGLLEDLGTIGHTGGVLFNAALVASSALLFLLMGVRRTADQT